MSPLPQSPATQNADLSPGSRFKRVFLSSTCYDLQDARAVVEDSLKRRGCRVLLSDRDSFPVDPSKHRHDVCVQIAGTADLLILVVDRRLGARFYRDPDITVTQAEFRQARAIGVPICAFVRTSVFDERLTWTKNMDRSFRPAHADDVGVFQFISEIQSTSSGVWITRFVDAIQIRDALDAIFSSPSSKHEIRGGRVVLTSLSRTTQRFLCQAHDGNNVGTDFTREQVQVALGYDRPHGFRMILPVEEAEALNSEFFSLQPVRPADNDGSFSYYIVNRTPEYEIARLELESVLQTLALSIASK